MSAALTRLKKRAVELEQKKQFDRALDVYIQILDEGGKELSDDDVPLYNRVGDMLIRKGNVSEALGFYERAVDMYAERGFLNNAIALCSKILRQSPGRTAVYYKLGRISARKGFKSDARKNFLEYADRMQKAGMADEAFRALKEFASLYPDQDDVRLILAELLSKENRKGEALEQLNTLYEKLESEGRKVEARATIERMRAIDPEVEPRVTGSHPVQQEPDLVFLDVSDELPSRPSPTQSQGVVTPNARVPLAPGVPALDGLTLTFLPDESGADDAAVSHPTGFEATGAEPSASGAAAAVPGESGMAEPATVEGLLDGMTETEPVDQLDGLEPTSQAPEGSHDLVAPLRDAPPMSGSEFADLDLADASRPAGDRPHDLVLPGELPATPEQVMMIGATPTSLASHDDARLAAEDEADLLADVAAREAYHQPPREPGAPPTPSAPTDEGQSVDIEGLLFGAADAGADGIRDAGGEARAATESSVTDWRERLLAEKGEPAQAGMQDNVDEGDRDEAEADHAGPDHLATGSDYPDVEHLATTPDESPARAEGPQEWSPSDFEVAELDPWSLGPVMPADADDFMAVPPSFGTRTDSGGHAFPPLMGLEAQEAQGDDTLAGEPEPDQETSRVGPAAGELEPPVDEVVDDAPAEPEPEPEVRLHTPRTTLSIGGAEQHLRRRLELDPENWSLRRQLGEALLDVGNRDGGMYELELAMVGYELDGDVERASEVAEEILSIFPGSIRHHQKRVEYAVRTRDRSRLIQAYLELADGLFRTGAGDKAVSVYGRVLELDGSNERAEFALATLAPDELLRRRGGAVRPERWSDELDAIPGSGMGSSSGPAAVVPSPGSPVSIEAVMDVVAATDEFSVVDPHSAETTDAVDAAPAADANADTTLADSEAVRDSTRQDGAPQGDPAEMADDWPSGIEDAPADAELHAEHVDGAGDEPSAPEVPLADDGEPLGGPEAIAGPGEPTVSDGDAATAAEPASSFGDPGTYDAWGELEAAPDVELYGSNDAPPEASSQPSASPRTDDLAPDEWAGGAADVPVEALTRDGANEPSPAAAATGPEAPTGETTPGRNGTGTPAEGMSRLQRARSLTPVGLPDDQHVDLGEWLRSTEPTRSTRMLVKDPQPTGDEQADFEELLRRFKRGVAENVEAEDYEAHYDLGVAYKEMGLVDEAIAQFQKALRGATHRIRSYEALGQCFVEKEQFPIAVALLQRATELPGTDDQQLVGVLYLLGFALEHMGRAAESMPYYLRVFAVDIEFRDIAARVASMGNLTT